MSEQETSRPPSSSSPENFTFEQALERLETIVQTLEDDEFDLEEALKAHAEGIALSRFCLELLTKAEIRIQNLSDT